MRIGSWIYTIIWTMTIRIIIWKWMWNSSCMVGFCDVEMKSLWSSTINMWHLNNFQHNVMNLDRYARCKQLIFNCIHTLNCPFAYPWVISASQPNTESNALLHANPLFACKMHAVLAVLRAFHGFNKIVLLMNIVDVWHMGISNPFLNFSQLMMWLRG